MHSEWQKKARARRAGLVSRSRIAAVLTLSGVLAAGLCARPAAAQVNLDGGVFTINDSRYKNKDIQLGLFSPATLNLIPDAFVASINAYQTSIVNIAGSAVGSVVDLHDTTALTLTGGILPTLILDNNSFARIRGGSVDSIYANNRSRIELSGGSVKRLGAFGSDTILIRTGASIGEVNIQAPTTNVLMTGGTVTNFVSEGSLTIKGGNLDGKIVRAINQGTINIYGYNLKLSSAIRGNDPLTGLKGTFYVLTGNLSNGSRLNTALFDADGGRQIGGTNSLLTLNITPAVAAPEPAPLALLGCCSLVLGAVRRARRR